MLKHNFYKSVDSDDNPVQTTVFKNGPIMGVGECGACPCLVVEVSHEWAFCGFHKCGLSYEGKYPRECKVSRIVVTEKF